MPFIIKFDAWNTVITPDKQEIANKLKEDYDKKLIQNMDEFITVRNEISDKLFEITGKRLYKSNCKYGNITLTTMASVVSSLINCADDPIEKDKWEKIHNKIADAMVKADNKRLAADDNGPLILTYSSDTIGGTNISFYPEEAEKEVEDIIKELNSAVKEDLKNAPLPSGDYNNNDLKRDFLEILFHYSEGALNGNLQGESAKTDDYIVGNASNSLVPGIGQYGIGLKPDSSPYVSDYARFEHLVPIMTPVVKAMRLMNGNIDYQKKGSKVSKDDELKVREQMLTEGADGIYAIDKIRKNMENERVKRSFKKEVENAYADSIGDRGKLLSWSELQRARRELITNGWTMPDIIAISRLASLFPTIDKENNEVLTAFKGKIAEAIKKRPENEEVRKEIIQSLIDEIDRLPNQAKEFLTPLAGIREDLHRAAEHHLSEAEKEIMADPSALKRIADAHPLKEYTADEQEKDLKWLEEIEKKDAELNDIFKKDPYAHDKIREMQALSKGNSDLIAEGVKAALGKEKWDAYPAQDNRKRDDLKAIDILTHPDSPYNVSNNHKLLGDVEKFVQKRIIDIPKKNRSNIGFHELDAVMMELLNAVPSISPGYKAPEVEISNYQADQLKGTAFNRQNEFIERLNKVLDSPGNLTSTQQRDELGRCIMGILGPLSVEAGQLKRNDDLFNQDKLSDEQKKELENSYTRIFGLRGGLISTPYAEKVMPVLKLMDKAFDKAEELMINDGHLATAINIKPIQFMIKNAIRGSATMKIHAMDPVIKVPEANLKAPVAVHIDRDKDPLIPGETKLFSLEEIEEKANDFPIHKVINAEYELKNLWGDYLAERQKGPLTPKKEKDYWKKIDACYTKLETEINYLVEKQAQDPSFADNNMRNLFGQSTAKKSFEDSISGSRAMKGALKQIRGRREAVNNGWPLDALGFYSHLEILTERIDAHINSVDNGGNLTKDYAKNLKEFKQLLTDKVLNKPYETDPVKRAELYADIAGRIKSLDSERKQLKETKGIDPALKDEIGYVLGNLTNVNSTDDGGMPYEYEARLYEKEARIEAVEKVKSRLDEIKNIADPAVYNELKRLVAANPAPKQDHMMIDDAFVQKSDIYLSSEIGNLEKKIEMVRVGKENTLEAKTESSHLEAIDRIRNILNASDSFFHFDSKQYKAVKEGLNKLHNNSGNIDSNAVLDKLTADVKLWLTDDNYNRMDKHSKNEFDNTRFNLMFTLANELDPGWAKQKFQDMSIAALHGDKAANTSFHNIHEFTNFMHRQMADGGFLKGAGAIASQQWYSEIDSYGQKGLVEEVLRIRADNSISENDKLNAELDNLNKLSGDSPNMTRDIAFKKTFSILDSYRQSVEDLANNMNKMEDHRYEQNKRQLIQVRENAISQIKGYLNEPENRSKLLFDKAALAYGVLDPKGAHKFIIELNEKRIGNKKIKPVSLPKLEKEQGLDLGGHRALGKKRLDDKNTKVKKQVKK